MTETIYITNPLMKFKLPPYTDYHKLTEYCIYNRLRLHSMECNDDVCIATLMTHPTSSFIPFNGIDLTNPPVQLPQSDPTIEDPKPINKSFPFWFQVLMKVLTNYIRHQKD